MRLRLSRRSKVTAPSATGAAARISAVLEAISNNGHGTTAVELPSKGLLVRVTANPRGGPSSKAMEQVSTELAEIAVRPFSAS